MGLVEKLQASLDLCEPISDPQERLALIVDGGRQAAFQLAEHERRDEHRIRGCVSQAWLLGELKDGRCEFRCAADSPLVQGLLACLCRFFSGETPEEVLACTQDPLSALGLLRNLSPTRQNGMNHARARIRALAEMMKGGTNV